MNNMSVDLEEYSSQDCLVLAMTLTIEDTMGRPACNVIETVSGGIYGISVSERSQRNRRNVTLEERELRATTS